MSGRLADLSHERGWLAEGWTKSPESAGKITAKPYPVRAVDITKSIAKPGRAGNLMLSSFARAPAAAARKNIAGFTWLERRTFWGRFQETWSALYQQHELFILRKGERL